MRSASFMWMDRSGIESCVGVGVCLCVCVETLCSLSSPAHLFSACSTCISAWLVLVPCSPAGSHLKTWICVCLPHLGWILSGWFSSVSELTYEPPLCGRISQNTRFRRQCSLGPSLCWKRGLRGGGQVLVARSLLALFHRVFLADKFRFFVVFVFSLLALDYVVPLQ